jgi:hypothetical protein
MNYWGRSPSLGSGFFGISICGDAATRPFAFRPLAGPLRFVGLTVADLDLLQSKQEAV